MPKQNDVNKKFGAPKFIMPRSLKTAITPKVIPAPTANPIMITAIRLAVIVCCFASAWSAFDCSPTACTRQGNNCPIAFAGSSQYWRERIEQTGHTGADGKQSAMLAHVMRHALRLIILSSPRTSSERSPMVTNR